MATQKNNQEKNHLNYSTNVSSKELGQMKTLTDKVTTTIFEDNKPFKEGKISKINFNFAKKAKQNKMFILEWEYDKHTNQITQFDKAVYDAVCTLFSNGVYIQTTQQIYELTTFSKYEAKPWQNKKIHDSMKRLLRLYLTLDVEEGEIQTTSRAPKKYTKDLQNSNLIRRKEDGVMIRRVEGLCLYWESIKVRLSNGREIYAYKIAEEVFNNKGIGVAYLYADWAKQIATYPREMYELPIHATDNNIGIRNQLLIMLHHNKKEPYMRTIKLLEKAGISPDCDSRKRAIKTIKTILTYWKEKGFIIDFHFEKKAQNKHYMLFIKKKTVEQLNKAAAQLKKGGQNG